MKCHLMQKSNRKSKLSSAGKKKLQETVDRYLRIGMVGGVEMASQWLKEHTRNESEVEDE